MGVISRRVRRCRTAALVVVLLGAPAATSNAQPQSIPILVPAPARGDRSPLLTFELVLTEVLLHRPSSPSRARPRNSNPALRHATTSGGVDVFAAERALSADELTASLHQLERDNAGGEGYLVLYERGTRRDAAHRVLLTREVGVVLASSRSSADVLRGRRARPVNGVAGAYIVLAADPLGSIALATELRRHPAVKDAYPLVKRFAVPK
jgi:hypothetical protein